MDITDLQHRVSIWHADRYPGADARDVALKLSEETGEACRAVVEHRHPSLHRDAASPLAVELGDVVIACAALAFRAGVDLDGAVSDRWATVEARRRR